MWHRICIFIVMSFVFNLNLRGGQTMSSNWWQDLTVKERMDWLTEQAKKLIEGCRTKANDGTVLYCPDGKGHYAALWTRDFAYMVENCPDMIPSEHVEACIRYLLSGQRNDGCIPDRRQPDGLSVYSAGAVEHPAGEPPLDNSQFMVFLVCDHIEHTKNFNLFNEFAPKLDKAMDYIPRSVEGLVFNDPKKPHSPYGFTDTVGKTGQLFFESLLYWRACKRMAELHNRVGDKKRAEEYEKRASLIERNIDLLWDDSVGMFLAASIDCRQIDIWGNAYALYIGFPLGEKRERILKFLVHNYDRYVWLGQIRHLLKGEYWQRLLVPVEQERYQNGAYWATASGWVIWALPEVEPKLAQKTFCDLVDDFKANGICECVNEGYRQLESYVVSATNPLGAMRRLIGQ
ncbi:MAG: hypothetical protein RMK18_11365 [Armatimonadota bacterium]|nr:hypothetical protein [Armatimonadota bacterium]